MQHFYLGQKNNNTQLRLALSISTAEINSLAQGPFMLRDCSALSISLVAWVLSAIYPGAHSAQHLFLSLE